MLDNVRAGMSRGHRPPQGTPFRVVVHPPAWSDGDRPLVLAPGAAKRRKLWLFVGGRRALGHPEIIRGRVDGDRCTVLRSGGRECLAFDGHDASSGEVRGGYLGYGISCHQHALERNGGRGCQGLNVHNTAA